MMISIGNKHFIESEHIIAILRAGDTRRDRIMHTATETGKLIDATEGRKIKSIIKLKSNHIVLSALGVETLKSRLEKKYDSKGPGTRDTFRRKHTKKYSREAKPSEADDRRIDPDRRHFSYTYYVPERRSGTERRNTNGKFQRERKT